MPIHPYAYESFLNYSIVPSGAWSFDLDSVNYCSVFDNLNDPYQPADPSGGFYIGCGLSFPFQRTLYHPTLEANISINLTKYGGATNLDFTWAYWQIYGATNVAVGSSIPVHSQVGDMGFDDNFPAVAYHDFSTYPAADSWDKSAPKISHSGSTSVVRGSDPTIGYIALQINLTMSTATNPNIQGSDLLYRVRDIGFNITGSAPPSATSSDPSSPSGPSSPPIGVIIGATVGAVVFLALLVTALLFFRRRRERAKGHMARATAFIKPVNNEDPLPHEGEGPIPVPWVGPDSPQPTPVGTVKPNGQLTTPRTEGIISSLPSGGLLNKSTPATGLVAAATSGTGNNGQHSSASNGLPTEIPPNTSRPMSMESSSFSMPDYPPPIYGLEESVRQDGTQPLSFSPEPASTSGALPPSFPPELARFASTSGTLPPVFSPELARFASANRDVINESLEARLQAAGYLPTDDPSKLTPEQWRNEHGVTRLELGRLQDLYARNR